MLRTALRSAAAAALVAAPALAQAQFNASFDRTFELCNVPQQFCAGVGLSLSGNTLTVGLRNEGSEPRAGASFLSGFGLFGGGLTGGTLTSYTFVGTPALPATGWASNGAGNDLQNGAGTQALPVGADFGNGGFQPCGYGDTNGGNVRRATCAGEYGKFVFTVVGSNIDLASIGFAVRAQGLQMVNGGTAGSDKCFSRDDANCRYTDTTPTPPTPPTPPAVVPEPSTYALVGAGLAGLLAASRRRRAA